MQTFAHTLHCFLIDKMCILYVDQAHTHTLIGHQQHAQNFRKHCAQKSTNAIAIEIATAAIAAATSTRSSYLQTHNNNKFMNSNKLLWGRNLCALICHLAHGFPCAKPIDKHNNISPCHFQFDWVFALFGNFSLEFFILGDFLFHSTIAVILQSIKMKALFLRSAFRFIGSNLKWHCTEAEIKSEEKHKISNTFELFCVCVFYSFKVRLMLRFSVVVKP